jgi:hypothetical protein
VKQHSRNLAHVAILAAAMGLLGCGTGGPAPGGETALEGTAYILGVGADGLTVTAYRDLGTTDGWEEAGQATTDSAGRFALSGLAEGTYTLYAAADGYAGVCAGVPIGSESTGEPGLWLVPAGRVSGQVALDGGGSCDGVRVSVVGVPVSAVTGSDGAYTLEGIPMGSGYTVVAAKAGFTVAIREGVDVAPGVASEPPVLALGATGNHPPTISTVTASPFIVAPSFSSSFLCRANDADGDPLTYAWGGGVGGSFSSTSGSTVSWTAPATGGNVLVWCTVSDGYGGLAFGTTSVLVAPTNHPPLIATVTANPSAVGTGGRTLASCRANDVEGDSLTYTWGAIDGTLESTTGKDVYWNAPASAGDRVLWVTVTDGKGGSTTGLLTIPVAQPNRAPQITAMTPANATDYGPGDSASCSVTAGDLDGDTLTYKWTATGGSFTGSGSSVTWRTPQTAGTFTIACEVTDGRGGVGLASRTVTVSNTNVIIW